MVLVTWFGSLSASEGAGPRKVLGDAPAGSTVSVASFCIPSYLLCCFALKLVWKYFWNGSRYLCQAISVSVFSLFSVLIYFVLMNFVRHIFCILCFCIRVFDVAVPFPIVHWLFCCIASVRKSLLTSCRIKLFKRIFTYLFLRYVLFLYSVKSQLLFHRFLLLSYNHK